MNGYEYKTGELWALCGQKHYGLQSSREIEFKHGYDNVDLKVNIPQGTVNIPSMHVFQKTFNLIALRNLFSFALSHV